MLASLFGGRGLLPPQPARPRSGGHHKSPTLSPGKGALEAGPHGVAEKADTSRSCKPGL